MHLDKFFKLVTVSSTYVLNGDCCCLQITHDEQVATWSAISKETKSLIHLNGVASVASSHLSGFRAKKSSNGTVLSKTLLGIFLPYKLKNVAPRMKTQRNRSCMHDFLKSLSWVSNVYAGLKDHGRPKFSFNSHTHGETSSKISDMAEIFEPDVEDQAIEEDPIIECPNSFDERSENRQGVSVAESREVLHECTKDAVPKLQEIPLDKIRLIKRSSELVLLIIQWISI